MSKSRNFTFTINNPTPGDDLEIELLKGHAKYFIYGRERGELGTPHYQGYVQFPHPVRCSRLSSLLSRAHVEVAKGNAKQNYDYCTKDGDFEEWGERPLLGKGVDKKQQWREIIKLAEEGDIEKIKEDHPHIYFLHHKKILDLRRRSSGIIDGDLDNEWWVGPTGTGKSRRLWALYPDHYAKSLNKWWDGYDGEDVVAIEEMNPDAGKWMGSFLKIWADRYPFSPEVKGSHIKKIRPQKIIVLSNYTPEQCFPNNEDLLPIRRRFKVVQFNNLSY
nr:Rep [Lactuca sativa CRESS virus]